MPETANALEVVKNNQLKVYLVIIFLSFELKHTER